MISRRRTLLHRNVRFTPESGRPRQGEDWTTVITAGAADATSFNLQRPSGGALRLNLKRRKHATERPGSLCA